VDLIGGQLEKSKEQLGMVEALNLYLINAPEMYLIPAYHAFAGAAAQPFYEQLDAVRKER